MPRFVIFELEERFVNLVHQYQEFSYVSTGLSHKIGGYGSYTDVDQANMLASNSGLMNFMFGRNRDKSFSKEQFIKKLQLTMKTYDYKDEQKDVKGKVIDGFLSSYHFLTSMKLQTLD